MSCLLCISDSHQLMKQILSALLAIISTECFMGHALSSIKHKTIPSCSTRHYKTLHYSLVVEGLDLLVLTVMPCYRNSLVDGPDTRRKHSALFNYYHSSNQLVQLFVIYHGRGDKTRMHHAEVARMHQGCRIQTKTAVPKHPHSLEC